jgi:hypothetical protein
MPLIPWLGTHVRIALSVKSRVRARPEGCHRVCWAEAKRGRRWGLRKVGRERVCPADYKFRDTVRNALFQLLFGPLPGERVQKTYLACKRCQRLARTRKDYGVGAWRSPMKAVADEVQTKKQRRGYLRSQSG